MTGQPVFAIHDQTIRNSEARLAAELGLLEGLAVGLVLPFRVYNTSIRYLDMSGNTIDIQNPFVHHRNETLTGLGDPWVFARGSRAIGGFTLGARLGGTIPLGRTVEDPFALGDMGIPHEHSQFGTGTFGAIAGIEASRELGSVRVEAGALTIQTFYENSHGYQAGDRYAGFVGAASSFGTKRWRFRATIEAIHETAERWSGVVHTDDGNIGRTDVLGGIEATWLVTEDWHVGISAKLPVYTHVVGGQLDPLGFLGLSVGTHFHAFGEEEEHDHDHAHHDHDHGHEHLTAPASLTPTLGKITVFDFWATWCAPCKVLDRELHAVLERHPQDLVIEKIDMTESEAVLPYIQVYGRDGKLLWEKQGTPLELAAGVEAAIGGGAAKKVVDPSAPRFAIEANDTGFSPERITIERGKPATLVFTRTSESTCSTDVHFTLPDGTKIDEVLPLGVAVEIPITIEKSGEIRYSCGMDMNHGTILVK